MRDTGELLSSRMEIRYEILYLLLIVPFEPKVPGLK